jgi:hypothetical protein
MEMRRTVTDLDDIPEDDGLEMSPPPESSNPILPAGETEPETSELSSSRGWAARMISEDLTAVRNAKRNMRDEMNPPSSKEVCLCRAHGSHNFV